MATKSLSIVRALCAVLLIGTAASCAPSNETSGPGLVEALHARHESGGTSYPFRTLAELLGNVRYGGSPASARPLTEAVVVGTVTEVRPGAGFRVEGNDAPSGIETDFDDPRALWRTFHVTVDVERVVSGDVGTGAGAVTVGFAFGRDMPLEGLDEEFQRMGRMLLFLNRSVVFDYDPDVYGTVLDGALLGQVTENDEIRLPVLDDFEEASFLQGGRSLGELVSAARREPRYQPMRPDGSRGRT